MTDKNETKSCANCGLHYISWRAATACHMTVNEPIYYCNVKPRKPGMDERTAFQATDCGEWVKEDE